MKRAILCAVAFLCFCGVVLGETHYIRTLADVPPELRQRNWPAARDGSGSCVNASTITILRFMGFEDHAKWWRENFEGGEWDTSHVTHLQASGLMFAFVSDEPDGGEAFLEWCSRNRLPAGIFFGQAHAQNFLGYMDGGKTAVVLDNNNPDVLMFYPREEFLREWHRCGGFAWSFVYKPAPPWPKQ